MNTCADVLLLKQGDKFIAADAQLFQIQLNDVEMPGMLYIGRHMRGDNSRDVLESLVVQRRIALPDLPEMGASL